MKNNLNSPLFQIPTKFKSVSVILPVMDEVQSLLQTLDILEKENKADLQEVLLVVCRKTSSESRYLCEELQRASPSLVRLIEQQRPFLGGAIQDAFDVASGSHVIIMASDLETDPRDVKELISRSKKSPGAVITASRWIRNSFHGYAKGKYIANYVFQKIFSLLYGTRLSDMTFGFRVLPASLAKQIRWTETRHAFLFETVIKPLRLGIETFEIPSTWKARSEGKSHARFLETIDYVFLGIRVLFQSRKSLLRE